jgi:enamine deaminase RidA (YjgF/YER057c/UK114 family)
MPSLLSGLGALGPRAVGAVAGGVIIVSYQWGTHVGAVPVDGGRRLGRPGEDNTVLGGQTIRLLVEDDMKELPCLMQPLVGLQVWRVGDVL